MRLFPFLVLAALTLHSPFLYADAFDHLRLMNGSCLGQRCKSEKPEKKHKQKKKTAAKTEICQTNANCAETHVCREGSCVPAFDVLSGDTDATQKNASYSWAIGFRALVMPFAGVGASGVEVDEIPFNLGLLDTSGFGSVFIEMHPRQRLAVGMDIGGWVFMPKGEDAEAINTFTIDYYGRLIGSLGIVEFYLQGGFGTGTALGIFHPPYTSKQDDDTRGMSFSLQVTAGIAVMTRYIGFRLEAGYGLTTIPRAWLDYGEEAWVTFHGAKMGGAVVIPF